MGDFADMEMENGFDAMIGLHGDSYDAFDNVMYDDETGAYEGHGHKAPKTCKYCGKHGLVWGDVNGKWRLFDGGTLHACNQHKPEPKANRREQLERMLAELTEEELDELIAWHKAKYGR